MTPDLKEIMLATIPATVPTLAVLVGILLNQNALNKLEARISALESRLHSDIARLDARIDALSKQMNDAILMLVNIGNELDKRITRLEDRQ